MPSFGKLSQTVSKLLRGHDFYTENYKGEWFRKNVDGATVVNIYMSSGYAFCAKFRESISNGIKVIERTQFLYGTLQRGIIPQKCRWSDHCLSLHVVW